MSGNLFSGSWRARAIGALVAAVLLAVAFFTLQPHTTPEPSVARADRVRAPRVDPTTPGPSPSPSPSPPPAPSGPSALQGESWPLRCPIADLEDGDVGFVRMERFGPVARRLTVSGGWLEGEADLPDGEGDLTRDGQVVARLAWREEADEALCRTLPVPWAEISGAVVDERGAPIEGAVVSGCGAAETTDPSGRFALRVPGGRSCRIRAHRAEPVPGSSEIVDAVAPATLDLTMATLTIDQVVVDLERRLMALKALDEVDRQVDPRLAPGGDAARTARTEYRARLEAALASGDTEILVEEWTSMQ